MAKFHRASEGDKIPISDYNLKTDYLEALVNLKVDGGTFKIDRSGASLNIQQGSARPLLWVKLKEDLNKCDDDETVQTATPTSALAYILKSRGGHAADAQDQDLYGDEPDSEDAVNTNYIRIYNRRNDFSAKENDIILVGWTDLWSCYEWTPIVGFPPEQDEDPDDDDPPTTNGSCGCGNCFKGQVLHNSTQCCRSFIAWTMPPIWQGCTIAGVPVTQHRFEYTGNDIWLTDPFTAPEPNGNEYRWKLDISIASRSYIHLVLETDNGGGDVCILYGRDSFDCLCDNQFDIRRPHGEWSGVDRATLSCIACLKPLVFDDPPGDLDLTVSSTACNWNLCAKDIDLGDQIELANQLIFQTEGFEGNKCIGFGGEETHFHFNGRSDACTEGEPDSFHIGAQVNHTWVLNRSTGTNLGEIWNQRASLRLCATVDAICARWGGTEIGKYTGTALDCTPVPAEIEAAAVLLKDGCDYWIEAAFEVPASGENSGAVVFYSDVLTLTEEGSYASDIISWFAEVHDMTPATGECSPNPTVTCVSNEEGPLGDACDCTDADHGDLEYGTAQLTTSATFLNLPPEESEPPNDTGTCQEECGQTPPAPEDPEDGACCYRSICFDYMSEEDCAMYGGAWNDDGCGDCEDLFSCCRGSSCMTVTRSMCQQFGGTIVDGSCEDDDPCGPEQSNPNQLGACCRRPLGTSCTNDSQCECYDDHTESTCGSFGTHYPGTTCAELDIAFSCTCDNPNGRCEQDT